MQIEWLRRHLDSLEMPDTILHVGSDNSAAVYSGLFSGANKVLVQPAPAVAAALRRYGIGEVRQVAVDASAGIRSFYVYNWPPASTLEPGAAVPDLYPGAAVEAELVVQTFTLEQIAEASGINGSRNILIVEVGELHELAWQYCADSGLNCFSDVFITVPHPDGSSARQVERHLARWRSIGFHCAGSRDTGDFAFTGLHFINDGIRSSSGDEQQSWVVERERLERDLEVAQQRLELRNSDLGELQDRYETLIQVFDEQQQFLAEISDRFSGLGEELERLASDSDSPSAEELATVFRLMLEAGGIKPTPEN